MKVAVRADASPQIGSGHVMRCLCLADALASRGAQVCFVCRPLPPHLADAIAAAGHRLHVLALAPPPGAEAPQAPWPAAEQTADARATALALAGAPADWIVVDHYGLDSCWEVAAAGCGQRLLAMDDLGRGHRCDILLDQNLHRDPAGRYRLRVPAEATLLLGPTFALLRPEFAQRRAGLEPRSGAVGRLLVFMGGMDAGNATGRALEAVSLLEGARLELEVVIGPSHPARAAIEAFCAGGSGRHCHVQTDRMAALLAECDLAVAAGGSATWERCCLGLPTLALPLADNQHALLADAARAGIVYVPDPPLPEPAVLAGHLQALLGNSALREAMSAAGMALVDGRGALRVAAAMLGFAVRVRAAQPQDCEQLHAWRNAPAVRAVSRNPAPISLDEHRRWFEQTLRSPGRALLVGEDSEGPLGAVRFDIDGAEAEVSIHLAPGRMGQGLGAGLLRAAESWLAQQRPQVTVLRAETLAGNAASRRLFEQSGYLADSHRFVKRTRHEC